MRHDESSCRFSTDDGVLAVETGYGQQYAEALTVLSRYGFHIFGNRLSE
jgi:hypothetical protein